MLNVTRTSFENIVRIEHVRLLHITTNDNGDTWVAVDGKIVLFVKNCDEVIHNSPVHGLYEAFKKED